ncbi:MAG: glycosyltransferase [Pirellulales bacterium]|nr:glycosyltransferase [Pirellulales bacterium]
MILFLTGYYPSHSRGGAQVRSATLLEHLHARGHRVSLVLASRRPGKEKLPGELARCVDHVSTIALAGRPFPGTLTRPLARATRPAHWPAVRLVQSVANWLRPRPSVLDEVADLVDRFRPEVLWVNGSYLTPLIARVPRHCATLRVVDTLDVMHLRDASLRQAGLPEECGVTCSGEIALLDSFDLVLAIQDEERQVLEEMLPRKRVITVGHACAARPLPGGEPAVVFVGSGGPTNVHAVKTFIERAWPRVLHACAGARLEIVGSVCRAEGLRNLAARPENRLMLRGTVARIADAYDGPAVVICPLWAGSGLKIKMVEALSYGKAVVASPTAAQGLESGIGSAFLVAETLEQFASAVIDLLTNLDRREALASAAADYASAAFGLAAVYAGLDEALAGRRAACSRPDKAA